MQLNAVERFALCMLFNGPDAVSASVRMQLEVLDVVDRKNTGVDFFTTILLTAALPSGTRRQWDWNFEHRRLSHGGSFMCWLEEPRVLEFEAVVYNGDWPDGFDPDDFSPTDVRRTV